MVRPILPTPARPQRIAYCLPTLEPLRHWINGYPVEASFIQQSYIIAGLTARHHHLSLIAQHQFQQTIYTNDLKKFHTVPRHWSAGALFTLSSKAAWRLQQLVGMPYLNIFANLRHCDACLRILPGHDLVFEQNSLYNIGTALACKQSNLPYVLFFDADEIMEQQYCGQPLSPILRWYATALLHYKLKLATWVICVSEQAKRHLMTAWRTPQDKVVVFPNAVDVEQFRPDPTARATVRAQWGLCDQPLMIFVGNFLEWQDVSTLLRAFALTAATEPDARLMLVGDGPTRATMQQITADLGLSATVNFTGQVPHAQIPGLLNAADTAVAPYPPMRQELWHSPMKLFEYMASGKAIIASQIGQIPEVITDQETGLLTLPGDIAGLAAAQQRLIVDPALRTQLGRSARQAAKQRYSWQHYVSHLEQLFMATVAHPQNATGDRSR